MQRQFQNDIAREQQQNETRLIRERLMESRRQRESSAAIQKMLAELGAGNPTISPMQQRLIDAMAQVNPQAAVQASIGLLEPDPGPAPTADELKLDMLERRISRPLTEREMFTVIGAGSLYETSDDERDE